MCPPANPPAIDSTARSVSPFPDNNRQTCRISKNACRELRSSRWRNLPSPSPPPLPTPPPWEAVDGDGGRGVGGGGGCDGELLSRLQRRIRLDILGRLVIAPSRPIRLDHSRTWRRKQDARGRRRQLLISCVHAVVDADRYADRYADVCRQRSWREEGFRCAFSNQERVAVDRQDRRKHLREPTLADKERPIGRQQSVAPVGYHQ